MVRYMDEVFSSSNKKPRIEKSETNVLLERDNFVDEDKEPYRVHLGLPVEIQAAGGVTHLGIYRGLTRGNDLALCPVLTKEGYILARERDREKTGKMIFYLSERPAFVNYPSLISISPVRQGYLEGLVGGGIVLVEPQIWCQGTWHK